MFCLFFMKTKTKHPVRMPDKLRVGNAVGGYLPHFTLQIQAGIKTTEIVCSAMSCPWHRDFPLPSISDQILERDRRREGSALPGASQSPEAQTLLEKGPSELRDKTGTPTVTGRVPGKNQSLGNVHLWEEALSPAHRATRQRYRLTLVFISWLRNCRERPDQARLQGTQAGLCGHSPGPHPGPEGGTGTGSEGFQTYSRRNEDKGGACDSACLS